MSFPTPVEEWKVEFAQRVQDVARTVVVSLNTAWKWRRRWVEAVMHIYYPENANLVEEVRVLVFAGSSEVYVEPPPEPVLANSALTRFVRNGVLSPEEVTALSNATSEFRDAAKPTEE